MASFFNKWLILALLEVPVFSYIPHPFHVSVTEINHNASDKTLEISCKIFTDDFEKILSTSYHVKADLTNPPDKKVMDSLVKKYIASHLVVKINGRPVTLNYVGFETDKEASYGYMEVNNINSVNKVEINNSIMYDLFDDQLNIIHVIANNNRKSTKLSYPNREAVIEF